MLLQAASRYYKIRSQLELLLRLTVLVQYYPRIARFIAVPWERPVTLRTIMCVLRRHQRSVRSNVEVTYDRQ